MTPFRAFALHLSAVLALAGGVAAAASPEETVRATMTRLAPQVKVDVAQESQVPGFFEAMVGSQLIYVSKDGRFVLDGSAFDVADQRDLTEAVRARQRLAGLARIGADKRIVFAPAKPRHVVTVFTDIDCPFCRRFHEQIARYNAAGIAVEYVFLPLDIHPGADRKAEAVWCAKDRKAAFTAAMGGADTGQATCVNPVADTTRIAREIGVGGTPTVLAADGTHIAAQIAMSPDQLAGELDRLAAKPAAAR
ncbi:MAG: DsbC family protein [Xanthomonadales bacterium]|nr:DsbC family protein [Xanthomonadales bacterium]